MHKARLNLTLLLVAISASVLLQADTARDGTRQRLEKEVRHELVMLPFYGLFDNLAFQIDGSKVTLLGQVTTPSLRTDAERLVRRIEGIENVENKIEVLPLSPNDDRIRRAEYRAIYAHTALARYALRAVPTIHIIVKNGHVTLEGAVASQSDKIIAGIQANGVPGVFSVANELLVDAER